MATVHSNVHNSTGMTTVLSAGAIILTLLQIFLGVILTSINANITRIEEQTIKHFAVIEAGFVRIGEYRQLIGRLDNNFAKVDAALKEVATRDEVNTRLGINSNSVIQIRSEVDVLKRDLGQTYSIKDALKDMQDQIKLLQGRQLSIQPVK